MDLRDAFFQVISDYAQLDSKITILTNDMEVFALNSFKKRFPNQFINVGVSEQNLLNVASGLAYTGKKVLIFGILSFIVNRAYEQLKLNICGMRLPVILVGIGPGLSFSFDGPSHHSLTDISLVRQLPGIKIYEPCDAISAESVAKNVLEFTNPTLIRLDKGVFSFKNQKNIKYLDGVIEIKPASRLNLIYSGTFHEYVSLLNLKLNEKKIEHGIFNIVNIWPVSPLLESIIRDSKEILVVDENTSSGGLFSIISEMIVLNRLNTKVSCINLNSDSIFEYGDKDWIRNRNGFADKFEAFERGLSER